MWHTTKFFNMSYDFGHPLQQIDRTLHPRKVNPLLTNGNYSYPIIKILILKKKGSWKNFPRLSRRWEPILGYISKCNGKKVTGSNGLRRERLASLENLCHKISGGKKGCGVGFGSRSRFFQNCWSQSRVFKTAGVGSRFSKLLESGVGFQNCWSRE